MRGGWLLMILALTACKTSDYEPQIRRSPADTYFGFDTAEPDTDTDPDVDTEPDTDPDTTPPIGDIEVCFLGQSRNTSECWPTVAPNPMPSGYDYPPALNGSAQYREPVRYLDLNAIPAGTKLAPNFALSEITNPSNGRYGVVQPHAIVKLQALRDQLGALNVNSGYRTPSHNASVGGVSSSRHQYGDAFDITPSTATLAALDAACDAQGADYVGVYTGHIHCDWRNTTANTVFYGPARRSFAPMLHPELSAFIEWSAGELRAPSEGWDEGEPLREWAAIDALGHTIHTATAQTYTPPADAVAVDVFVGRRLSRRLILNR